ncbi:hypothetical protein FUAX_26100 [Fulvitalea axinellae]|uniref:Alpha-galactosidase n=1 Tax=Fulvitalea axinellae TaxID=1182444 RepID=A0AAU9D2I4_9BACT|nr:hypothetical protein FUAX_26100 [Fulvitalea axinellae]
MLNRILTLLACALIVSCQSPKQDTVTEAAKPTRKLTPIMGWASWNNYRVHINEDIIKKQADAMASNGMKEAGYQFINIDDGYFGGRDRKGNLLVHPERFPNGMGKLAEYIHSKGLKAGIYTDGGINTCASYWDKDTIGVGMGLYGHERQDLELMLKDWKYDFIKVDWCGGEWMGLNDKTRYTEIGEMIRELRPDVIYNICRWRFPGEWAPLVGDSWRISGDIANKFESVAHIIDKNADLWKYAGPGHVNDMDMLQIGRGMTYEEDKTHFTMWAVMCSPLMAGNDMTNMSDQTLEILTNKEIIALNQDPLVYQARRVKDYGDLEVWGKPLGSTNSGLVAVTLLNRSKEAKKIGFSLKSVGMDASKGYTARDLWNKKDYPSATTDSLSFEVPSHGVVVLKLDGASLPYNVYQYK